MLATPTSGWLEAERDALLDFAAGARTPLGFGWLDNIGSVPDPGSADLWITCRMTHIFSLGALLGRAGCADLADHGVRALSTTFADSEHGGWFTTVERQDPGDKALPAGEAGARKEAYPHAFVLIAASSATAAGRPGAAELLGQATQVHTDNFWREDEGMALEGWDRAFTTAEKYRGVNANMHTLEAYLTVADVTGDGLWLDRALRIARRVVNGFARQHNWRIPEHFTTSWEPVLDYNADQPAHPFRPYGATPGHWFEWARLTLHLRAALANRRMASEPWMLEAPQALFDAAVREGWAVDGAEGFVYTVDAHGDPVVRERMHWVVCEAIGAAAALYAVTADEEYAHWYQTWWDYAQTHFIEAPGRWRHELDAANTPSAGTWTGKPDVYHVYQATLLPRLPLSPAFAPAIRAGLLDN